MFRLGVVRFGFSFLRKKKEKHKQTNKFRNFLLYSQKKKKNGSNLRSRIIYLGDRVEVLIWRTAQTIDGTTHNTWIYVLGFNILKEKKAILCFILNAYRNKLKNINYNANGKYEDMWWAFVRYNHLIWLILSFFLLFNCVQSRRTSGKIEEGT